MPLHPRSSLKCVQHSVSCAELGECGAAAGLSSVHETGQYAAVCIVSSIVSISCRYLYDLGPDLLNISRQSYDNAKVMTN